MAKKELRDHNNKYLFLILAIILIITSILIIWFKEKGSQLSYGTNVGDSLPELKFKAFNDQQVKLSDFRGNGLIINSWATWCPLCDDEMANLQKFDDENNDINVLFVHRTSTESIDKAKKYLDNLSFEITSTNVIDP